MLLIYTIILVLAAVLIAVMFNLHYRKRYKADLIDLETLKQKNVETFWLLVGLLMLAAVPEAFGLF